MISKNQLKYYAALKRKPNREQYQRFIVEGLRLCEEALDSDYQFEIVLHCPAEACSSRARELIDKYKAADVPVEEINSAACKQISDTENPQGILAIAKMQKVDGDKLLATSPRVLVALDAINDPGNLGTIIRSASWFGIDAVLIGENSVEATNPKVVRSSMGSVFHLSIWEKLDLLKVLGELKENGYEIYASDARGEVPYNRINFDRKYVIVFGNEISGVNANLKKIANGIIAIPGRGRAESLNVAVAAGIILAETTGRN
ncbi:MAG: TrmH family RNA methyltransferase [bacterium]